MTRSSPEKDKLTTVSFNDVKSIVQQDFHRMNAFGHAGVDLVNFELDPGSNKHVVYSKLSKATAAIDDA